MSWSGLTFAQDTPDPIANLASQSEIVAEAHPEPDADQQPEDKKPPTPPHTGLRALFGGVVDDFKNLPSRGSMYILLAGGGAALAVHPLDATLNAHLRSHYTLVNDLYAPAKYFGDTPEQVGLSLVTYAWGRVFDQPKVSHLGMDLIQAQIMSEVLVDALKISVRRDRPDNSQGHWNFSFPSGHSAETFAGATVLERHLGWKKAALAYLVATYVATSRLHDNVHFASDVVFGAAVGTMAGRTVTRHGPNAWTLAPTTVPGGGFAILVVRTPTNDSHER
jgi:membrane-associated phospholipid phosphatase